MKRKNEETPPIKSAEEIAMQLFNYRKSIRKSYPQETIQLMLCAAKHGIFLGLSAATTNLVLYHYHILVANEYMGKYENTENFVYALAK